MGFFDRFQKREQVLDETHVSDVLLRAMLNGETITREKALTLPAVSGAVDFISNCVATMPVKLFKYKQGKIEAVEDDPRIKLLNGDTGDTLDAFQMKKAMVEDYLLGKGGYAFIRRDRNDVTGLFYVEERYITIFKTYEPIFKHYSILVMGKTYQPWDFIKLLRNTKDGASGIGLTVEVSKALETAYNSMLYQLGMVKSGGSKKGYLKSQRRLGQEEIDVLKAAWRKLYENSTENIVVLNNGIEFQEASSSSLEMQMNESKRTFADEINDLFHISSDFELTFKLAIYPIIKAFETALNRDLLLEKEKKNYFFEFDIKEIIKASLATRYNAYKTAKETGFMTINEIRRAENMNYVEGLDVVNVGLGAVLYDINTHTYYTPNTDTVGDPNNPQNSDQENPDQENMDKMLEGHELVEAYDESGNSAERSINERFNDVHDAKTGRFGVKSGSGGGIVSGNTFDGAREKLEKAGVAVDISKAGKFSEQAKVNVEHLSNLNDEYNSTMVSYAIGKSGGMSEAGNAYMHNGNTAITVDPMALKGAKAQDALGLGENALFATTYHEFAHSLSQSRQPNSELDEAFWGEIKKIRNEYNKQNDGGANWQKIKISDYASKDADEFMAEAFTKAKLHNNPNNYEKQVLSVIDKYYSKKKPNENGGGKK